jgi:predicted Zn-dependent peptidase
MLASGARLLLDQVPTTDTVSIGFWLPHGSRDEKPEEKGLSHFMEHMLFKGTEKRNAFQIALEIDRVGGILNAFTEKEATCVYATLSSEHLSLAIDVLSDMVFCSVLDPGEIEKEKSVVVNEILSSKDSSEEMAHEAFLSCLWGDHPLAARITGDVEDIQAVTRNRLHGFYKARYLPPGVVVAVAGRFDPTSTVESLGHSLASGDDGGYQTDRRSPIQSPAWKHVRAAQEKVQIYAGTYLPANSGDLAHLYDSLVFSTAVGESMSSRLFQEIRENKALCYSISSFRSLYTDTALWSIYANTTPVQLPVLLEALNMELKRLHTEPIAGREVEDAKSHLQGSLILTKEDMEARMKRLFRLYSLTGGIMDFSDSLKHIEEVTTDRVRALVTEIVNSSRFTMLAYGSKHPKGFQKLRFDF